MQKFFRLTSRAGDSLAFGAVSLAVVSALAVSEPAHASAFQLYTDSAQSMGRAYGGSATAGGDISVVATNPAAMTMLQGTYMQGDITAINFGTHFSGSGVDGLGRPLNGDNGGNGGTTMPIPALTFVTQFADKWHVGGAFTVPYGFQTEYNQKWVGRYNAIDSKFESLDGTLSLSYDLTDNFTLGVSGIAQKTSAQLTSAINYNMVGMGLVNQAVGAGAMSPAQGMAMAQQVGAIVPPGTDGFTRIKGSSWAYGWQLGAFWKITPNDRLAFNYRSSIAHTLEGTGNFTVPPNVQALLSSASVAPMISAGGNMPFTRTLASAGFTTPASAGISYWHQAEKFGIGVDVDWTQWDVFKNLTVNYANPAQPSSTEPFNWRNTWYMGVGADYYLTDKLTLRGGLGIDTTPTATATRDPRVPDANRRLLSVGVGYKASDRLVLNASYMHIFVNKASIDTASSTGDLLAGSFDDYGNIFSLSVQYKF